MFHKVMVVNVVSCSCVCFFFFKQKTAYEVRISDWSSDVCSSDLARLAEAARSLSDRLEDALIEAGGEQGGVRSHRRFERAFPSSYQRHFDAAVAVEDIHHIEEAIASGELSMNLHRPAGLPAEMLHSKIYVLDRPVPLSDILPMLENMGLKVLDEDRKSCV